MLRPLSKTDCPMLQEINAKALGYLVSLDLLERQYERLIEDCHHYFLAYADKDTNQLLGYVHAERYETLYASDGLISWAWLFYQPIREGELGVPY
ncbi:acetyltransferase family protein [Streptococcus pyogenes]|nr:hypothetical protein HMPREF1229_1170 [Streptococcus pyogenes GA40634]SQF57424.1 acetyltransferase family protein [Streptococcus pyogenes]VGT92320.1 acetyltransferase family protein [Streptococcus pyogenes]VHE48034.1 acetyltransferase family protein [Streptococcus pyogenes]VHF87530.1 acetyltransferase family protein [Streptococcus pyogenes]